VKDKDRIAKQSKHKNKAKDYSIALSTKELCGIELMYENGVALSLQNRFSRSLEFGDLSYAEERQDIKDAIFEQFCAFHALFPPLCTYQINLVNKEITSVLSDSVYVPESGANRYLAQAQNKILYERTREGVTNIERHKYITFSVLEKDLESSERRLSDIRESIYKAFSRLGVSALQLDGLSRLECLHSLINTQQRPFLFDYEKLKTQTKRKSKDFIAPSFVTYPEKDILKNTLIVDNTRFVRTLKIRDFGTTLSDRAIGAIRDLPVAMNISLTFEPQIRKKSISDVSCC
jgi:hypothetical protein